MIGPDTIKMTIPALAAPAPATPSAAVPSHHGFSFHDLLEIANPLQHLPIVSTLYRHLTGDKINTFDKVAGDTLYGGPIGFASSMADTLFEHFTGRSFGETVLAFFVGDKSTDSAVAQNAPASPQHTAAVQTPAVQAGAAQIPVAAGKTAIAPFASPVVSSARLSDIVPPDLSALQAALLRNGTDPAIAQRAAFAYRRATGLTDPASVGR